MVESRPLEEKSELEELFGSIRDVTRTRSNLADVEHTLVRLVWRILNSTGPEDYTPTWTHGDMQHVYYEMDMRRRYLERKE